MGLFDSIKNVFAGKSEESEASVSEGFQTESEPEVAPEPAEAKFSQAGGVGAPDDDDDDWEDDMDDDLDDDLDDDDLDDDDQDDDLDDDLDWDDDLDDDDLDDDDSDNDKDKDWT